MQHGVSGKLDGHLASGWGPLHKALLVVAGVCAALVVSWMAYLLLVAAFLVFG